MRKVAAAAADYARNMTIAALYRNGKEQIEPNGVNGVATAKRNGHHSPETANGVATNGQHVPSNGHKAPVPLNDHSFSSVMTNATDSSMASPPEVNQWTSLMTSGVSEMWDTHSGLRGFSNGDDDDDDQHHVDRLYEALRDLSEMDLAEIESYWERLLPKVSYLGTEKALAVYNGLRVAYRAHREQRRKSGEPFIIHPVEVALLLADLQMDYETVVAGLLHDTVEDTDLTLEDIDNMFGSVVRSIVEGETKVSKLPKLGFADYADEQAENLRQMFVAMSDDYRIIIVKLADRLHNMRTLQHMKPHKQIKISRETLDIFAPLAHRMGIWQFKSELEDIAFRYLFPQEHARLTALLEQHQTKFQETLDKSQSMLRRTLSNDPTLRHQAIDVKVYGRTKELYSLWHKMETKKVRNLDHISDAVALRVIITPNQTEDQANPDESSPQVDRGVWLCYHVLALVQHLPGFLPVPTKVKDYISFPKPNGYQSLHTALMLNGQTIEVQIRTSAMHHVAEYGMASHWSYVDGKRRPGTKDDLFNTPWLSSIKEWQDEAVSSRDFVDSVRRELLGKRVFVFLRNGKILNLARGATVIDAAFQIHSEVGLQMHSAEINGKPVPFSYVLRNGDVVNILTGKGKPATDWMRYAKSRSTRSKLRSYFRKKQKESLKEAGMILLMDYLWMHGDLIERESYMEERFVTPTNLEDLELFLPGKTRFDELDDLLIEIGKRHDRAFLHSIISKLFYIPQKALRNAEKKRRSTVPNTVAAIVDESRQVAKDAASVVGEIEASIGRGKIFGNPIHGVDAAVEYVDPEHLCQDCLPVPGDEIVGTKSMGDDITALCHRKGCPHAQRAVNQASAGMKSPLRIDSHSLRTKSYADALELSDLVPVQLKWPNEDDQDVQKEFAKYLAEVVVVAQDRKLLLADCSEIVSECVEIVKTGSATTHEHAKLLYLVKVSSLDGLQTLMDRLSNVPSVMSVERRVCMPMCARY